MTALSGFAVLWAAHINMAVTIKNLGGTPYVVSCVGRDAMGEGCLDYLRKKGLPLDCVKEAASASTGYCLVFVEPDGERTFLTKAGCEGKFDESLISGRVADSCRVAAVTGYYLLGNSGGRVASLLEKLKAKGCAILFDPSMVKYRMMCWIGCGISRCNRQLDGSFGGGKRISEGRRQGPEAWAEVRRGRTQVILTRGAGGIVFEGDRRLL